MRLLRFLQKLDEEGEGMSEIGTGATTTGKIALYPQRLKLGITRREAFKNCKKKKKRLI